MPVERTMTGNPNNKDQFTAQADSAATRLRAQLQQQGRQIADSASVEVGPDGKPPAPPPPEGSYARMEFDRQRAQAQSSERPTRAEEIGDQPQAGTVEQAMDGSQGPRLDPGQPPTEKGDEPSPRAQQRIQELIDKLRTKDREQEQLLENSRKQNDTVAELSAKLEMLQRQHEQILRDNLDQLDPETQRQVLLDQHLNELFSQFERRIDQKYAPQLQSIENRNLQSEMATLSEEYPMFDVQIHGQLIEMFRGKNPNCTIEQAWKAIATPEELVTRTTASAAAVPPVVPPGQHDLRNVRYASEPEPQSNPEAEMVEESRRIKELRASDDPAKQKEGLALIHQNLARRLGL